MAQLKYTEADIQSLDWKEHIRLRPGMYIGQLGDGSQAENGIYLLLKEVIDNGIDEHMMGHGKRIEITCTPQEVSIRDYGRGIPFGKLVDCAARINTGGKYNSTAFQKSIGLNGVGIKAVNALSSHFVITSFRDGKCKQATFCRGELLEERPSCPSKEADGSAITFVPDPTIFQGYSFQPDLVEEQVKNYSYLNPSLTLVLNGKALRAKGGLLDLLTAKTEPESLCYPIIHLQGRDIEVAMSHHSAGECYYTFVNGQMTPEGGTHLAAFKEIVVKAIQRFYKKEFNPADIRSSLAVALTLRIQEPLFQSQTKTKLGSTHTAPQGTPIRTFVRTFLVPTLDNYLHRHPKTAEAIRQQIVAAEKERKAIANVRKAVATQNKRARIHNKKLRDCKIHLGSRSPRALESTLFITEGNSASGSITQTRDVATQAVFSLRGKPLNCFGVATKTIYQNEEFHLLQHALGIGKGIEKLRYNKIVLATDADVDGMHIRLLILTYFLQSYPELVREGHLYILETPLFRVRNKKKTHYCYSEVERQEVLKQLGATAEITRFKGLGEISAHEFKHFIGKDIRLTPVPLLPSTSLPDLLNFYMGRNTSERKAFIIQKLRTLL
jgi:topoisomerase-4 subunit B